MEKIGTIDISELNIPPEKHELATARFFSELGKDVRFIRPVNIKGVRTPDFYMDGVAWETKSPTARNVRSIEDNFRYAVKQSNNIIFDLRRSRVPEYKSIIIIRRIALRARDVKRVLVITKSQKLLTIKFK